MLYYIFWFLKYKNNNIKTIISLVFIVFIFEYIFHSNIINYLYEVNRLFIFKYEYIIFRSKLVFSFYCLLLFHSSFNNLKYTNYIMLFFLPFYLNDIYIILGYILFLLNKQYRVIFEFIKIEYKNILLVFIFWFCVLALYYDNFLIYIIKYPSEFVYFILLFVLAIILYLNNVLFILFIEFIFFLSLLFLHFDYLYHLMQLMAVIYSFYFVSNYKDYFNVIKSDKLILILFSIIFVFFISYFISHYIYEQTVSSSWYFNNSRYFFNHFLLFLLLLVIFITYMPKKYYKYILYSFLISVFISEIFSYLIYFNLINIELFKRLGILYYKTKACDPSPFTNHINYSTFVAISLIILLYKINIEQITRLKYLYIFIFSIEFLNLFINGGRTGQLMVFISIIIYIFYYNKKHIIKSLTFFIIGVFLLFNFHTKCDNNKRLLLGVSDLHKVYNNDYYRTSWGKRIAINLTAIDYLTKNVCTFMCGSGASIDKKEWNKQLLQMPNNISKPISNIYIHSSIFQIWFDGGFFAIILCIYLLYILFKISYNPAMYSLIFVIIIYSLQDQILMGLEASKYSLFLIVLIFIYIFKERKEIVFSNNSHV